MYWPALLLLSDEPALEVDAPGWAPILFAAGAFVVVATVMVLMWKKIRQSEQWRRDEDTPDD
ncbi:hypothetical protein [Nesterenkonia alkaliphila]|uniref:Uncharacterized protein n=1 Tax=Nesterenkonia alkaliphila TaxID=1463631 RepID=A0A7K1UGQ5_9MICC|nr:hypothetical protein [Nesterenkonia alkaliphila]MVT25648.1 hypothetical protein [Nesterenkonia alkaliphila]GFZ84892.1 hypothetical protein GCM10011359_12320 [Nesterenkonia alkaliphila]